MNENMYEKGIVDAISNIYIVHDNISPEYFYANDLNELYQKIWDKCDEKRQIRILDTLEMIDSSVARIDPIWVNVLNYDATKYDGKHVIEEYIKSESSQYRPKLRVEKLAERLK